MGNGKREIKDKEDTSNRHEKDIERRERMISTFKGELEYGRKVLWRGSSDEDVGVPEHKRVKFKKKKMCAARLTQPISLKRKEGPLIKRHPVYCVPILSLQTLR